MDAPPDQAAGFSLPGSPASASADVVRALGPASSPSALTARSVAAASMARPAHWARRPTWRLRRTVRGLPRPGLADQGNERAPGPGHLDLAIADEVIAVAVAVPLPGQVSAGVGAAGVAAAAAVAAATAAWWWLPWACPTPRPSATRHRRDGSAVAPQPGHGVRQEARQRCRCSMPRGCGREPATAGVPPPGGFQPGRLAIALLVLGLVAMLLHASPPQRRGAAACRYRPAGPPTRR